MSKFCIAIVFVLSSTSLWAQQYSMSLGVFTGMTTAFTNDEGINRDPRYKGRYELKFAPIGVNFGMDYERFGFMVSPGLINVGQNFYVINTSGGQDGLREINLQYLNVPVAFKVHIFNLSFFKISALASLSGAFLMDGKDIVSHKDTKLYFPTEKYSILPPGYTVQYDGVMVPEVKDYPISAKSDFRSLQVFAAAGFRSDWDISNHWRVSFDCRVNYGLFDPRTDAYITKLNSNSTLYDMPGGRRDMFVQLNIGISRYIDFEKSDQERKRNLKGNHKRFTPKSYPGQKTRTSKPRG
ncbi:outer membrane beta-barrel protein [Chryseolinea lacunae]|uniref:Outer membrane beta-barrel protein n=1 Tax=Chryseolinea lacunae TaxID=2801331 RepID=A0ABS1KXI6_9BACT|nr:outer membrane beta-barrel protein [Chryseolinea lacunae]MBL0743972.1 outer membrane beta-barrel protein [Chryseolinea lacunae]